MYLTFAILCVFYVYFMCAAIGVIINDDDDDDDDNKQTTATQDSTVGQYCD